MIEAGTRLPELTGHPDDLLNPEQDQALFEALQERGAFKCVIMNEVIRFGPNGRRLTDAQIYEKLRGQEVHWNIDEEGWYQELNEIYKDDDEDAPFIFEELSSEGALDTPGVRRTFGVNTSEYTRYQQIREMQITWASGRRVWQDRNPQGIYETLFDDVEIGPEGRRGAFSH